MPGEEAIPSFLPSLRFAVDPSLSRVATGIVLPISIVKSWNSFLSDAVPIVSAPTKLPVVSLPIMMV